MSSSFGDSKRKPGASSSQLIENRRLATMAQTWTFSSKQAKVPSGSYIPSVMGRLSGVLAIQNEVSLGSAIGGSGSPTYFITPDSSTITEGSAVVFTVVTTNVPDGTVLTWQNIGTTDATDFLENVATGSITVNSGSATLSLTLIVDPTIETGETIQIQISSGSTVVATSSVVSVIDASPTYSVSPSGSTVDEGLSVTFTVTTTNVASGTTLYWTTTGTATAADFVDNVVSGSFTITNGSGTIVRTLTADATTEGGETITLQVRTGSITGTIVATSTEITVNDTSLTPTPPSSSDSLLALVRGIETTYAGGSRAPSDAGALTINSLSVGNYDLCVVNGNTTVSSFNASDWFTNTQDTHSAVIVVLGNLTINLGQTFTPSVRKLFTLLYVTGNLVLNGTISMTARGANHSGTGTSGGATTAVAIRIGTGTFSAVSNPQIPAAGGAGGPAKANGSFNNGSAGTNGGTGGGGTGESISGTIAAAGSAGTCFSGGTGSGGALGGASQAGEANGGKGGNSSGAVAGGGTGNPGGTGSSSQYNGLSGTGGTLIVIVKGTMSGNGSFVSNGTTVVRPPGSTAGGGSGAGSVNILYGTDSSTTTTVATGGAGIASGSGGNGTARKLAIGAN